MWVSSGDACIGALCLVQQNIAVDALVHELLSVQWGGTNSFSFLLHWFL